MNPHPSTEATHQVSPPSFLARAEWEEIITALKLAPQQVRIVALILQGKKDKQIASTMGVSIATVRTHLTRLFIRAGVSDRVELILRIFADCHQRRCHQE